MGVTPPPFPGRRTSRRPSPSSTPRAAAGRGGAGVARGAEIATRREPVRLGATARRGASRRRPREDGDRRRAEPARGGARSPVSGRASGRGSWARRRRRRTRRARRSAAGTPPPTSDGATPGRRRGRADRPRARSRTARVRVAPDAGGRSTLGASARARARGDDGREPGERAGRVSGTRRSRSARGTPRARRRARPPRSCVPRTRSSPSRAWRRKTRHRRNTASSHARGARRVLDLALELSETVSSAQRRGRARRRRRRLGRRRVRRNHRVRGARRRGRAQGRVRGAVRVGGGGGGGEGAVFATEAVRAACRRTHEFVDRTDRTAGADGNGVGAAVGASRGRTRRKSRGTRQRGGAAGGLPDRRGTARSRPWRKPRARGRGVSPQQTVESRAEIIRAEGRSTSMWTLITSVDIAVRWVIRLALRRFIRPFVVPGLGPGGSASRRTRRRRRAGDDPDPAAFRSQRPRDRLLVLHHLEPRASVERRRPAEGEEAERQGGPLRARAAARLVDELAEERRAGPRRRALGATTTLASSTKSPSQFGARPRRRTTAPAASSRSLSVSHGLSWPKPRTSRVAASSATMNRAGSRPRGFIPSRRTDARTVQASAGVPGRNANAGGGRRRRRRRTRREGEGRGDDERDATRARPRSGRPPSRATTRASDRASGPPADGAVSAVPGG